LESVFEIVTPVFGIVLIGWVAARAGVFGKAAIDGISDFVFTIAIPLLLFRTLATAGLPDDIPWNVLLSYYLGVYAVFAVGMLIAAVFFRKGLSEQGAFAGSGCFPNTVLLGIPIILAVFGEAASIPLFLVIGVHNALLLPVLVIVLGMGQRRTGAMLGGLRETLVDLVRNPLVIGLVGGVVYGRIGPPLPGPVDDIIRMLGTAGAPVALFVLGGTLARYRISGYIGEASVISGLKLVVQPLVVWTLATRVFDLEPTWAWVITLLSAMPTGVNVFIFANRYGAGTATAGTTIVLSTALGAGTISGLIWLIEHS
jgi:predicted permease